MMLVLLLFMHLLVVDEIIVILFCTMFKKVKRIDYKDKRMCQTMDRIGVATRHEEDKDFRINVRVS